MASKGQKFASYSLEFKNEVLEAYKSGIYGGRNQVAKHYNISSATIWNWISKIENKEIWKMIFTINEVELKNQI